nr:MAG TPA: hypothetical protein [Caudoviricetes sp.]
MLELKVNDVLKYNTIIGINCQHFYLKLLKFVIRGYYYLI